MVDNICLAPSITRQEISMSANRSSLGSSQDLFLDTLRKERIPVSIFLVSGIKLVGEIEAYDQFVVLLRSATTQVVYKHAIATVVPSRAVGVPYNRGTSGNTEKNANQDGAALIKALRTTNR